MGKRKQLNAAIGVFEANKPVSGLYLGVKPLLNDEGNQVTSKTYGTPLFLVTLADIKTGEVSEYFADGGLRGAIKLARLRPEQPVEIMWTGEHKDIEEGRVKVYEIYDAASN